MSEERGCDELSARVLHRATTKQTRRGEEGQRAGVWNHKVKRLQVEGGARVLDKKIQNQEQKLWLQSKGGTQTNQQEGGGRKEREEEGIRSRFWFFVQCCCCSVWPEKHACVWLLLSQPCSTTTQSNAQRSDMILFWWSFVRVGQGLGFATQLTQACVSCGEAITILSPASTNSPLPFSSGSDKVAAASSLMASNSLMPYSTNDSCVQRVSCVVCMATGASTIQRLKPFKKAIMGSQKSHHGTPMALSVSTRHTTSGVFPLTERLTMVV